MNSSNLGWRSFDLTCNLAVEHQQTQREAEFDETVASTGPGEEFGLVEMTPLIAPGVDASPLMTWGDIEGTPMIIGAAPTPGRLLLILSCMGDAVSVPRSLD